MDNQEIQEIQLLKKRIAIQLEKRNHRHDINRLQQYIKQTIQTDQTKFLLSVNEEIIRKQQKIQELNHRAQQLNTKIKKLKRRQQAEIRRQIKEQARTAKSDRENTKNVFTRFQKGWLRITKSTEYCRIIIVHDISKRNLR